MYSVYNEEYHGEMIHVSNSYHCHSSLFENNYSICNDFFNGKYIILFVGATVNGLLERKLAFERLISLRYGINGSLISEQNYTNFSGLNRIGALIVPVLQIKELLLLLDALPYKAFLVCQSEFNKNSIDEYMQIFSKGILESSVLNKCYSKILENTEIFVYATKGHDGDSINYIYKNRVSPL